MGQYFIAVFLEDSEDGTKRIVFHFKPMMMKLMEHAYLSTTYTLFAEFLLSPVGPLYKKQLVWAGDYGDTDFYNLVKPEAEGADVVNLQEIERIRPVYAKKFEHFLEVDATLSFIVNHSKKQYVDKSKLVSDIHPLPLLAADGNGMGMGDYRGHNEDLCGSWMGDSISMEREAPSGEDFVELLPEFHE